MAALRFSGFQKVFNFFSYTRISYPFNSEARHASPAVQIAAPSRIKSFAKNCPGIGDGNGKP